MSGISRIDKFVVESKRLASLTDAKDMRTVPLNIVLGEDDTGKVAMMVIIALNLAIRCLKGPIRIISPDEPGVSLSGHTLSLTKILEAEASKAEATERIELRSVNPGDGVTIGLGCDITEGFSADCAGWVSFINKSAPQNYKNIPAAAPAAVFAIASAFAKLFNSSVLGNVRYSGESWQFSLLRFDKKISENDFHIYESLNLGSISMLGAGAIGSGMAFTLSLSDYYADILVIDKDRYEEPNFETTMLIAKSDELGMKPKAECLAAALNNGKIKALHCKEEVCASSQILSEKRDVLICGVDNSETRRELDNANVKVILNGGVGGSKADAGHILVSRHPRGGENNLSELYPTQPAAGRIADNHIPGEFADECSRISYLNVSMAAPFLGTAVGALLVAGCVQDVLGSGNGAKYLKFDLSNYQQNFCI